MTRPSAFPLIDFLDAGGLPSEWLPGDRLEALALDVARLWSRRHTPKQRHDYARIALSSYMATMVLPTGNPTPVNDETRDIDEIVGLWTADLLRDGGLFLRFVATLPRQLRTEVAAAVRGQT